MEKHPGCRGKGDPLSRAVGDVEGGLLPRNTGTRIEETALDLFYQRGFKSTTVREIAVACGLTPGALYNHFPSKHHLLASIMREGHLELLRRFESALDAAGDVATDQLRAIAHAHALFHTNYQKGARVASQELYSLLEPVRSEIIGLRQQGREIVIDILARGKQSGVFEISDIGAVANELLTMGVGVAGWFRENGHLSAGDLADIHADLVLRMVVAR